jgi:DinB superfamily
MNEFTLKSLANFPDQLEALYATFPDDGVHWKPESWDGIPSESLTALEQLCHVRDIEIDGYHARIDRTLNETQPLLASLDTYRLRNERHYDRANAAEAIAAFRTARVQTLEKISRLTDAQWSRSANFEGYGAVTLRGILHYLASHDQQHLAGLQWLLGKLHARGL